MNLATIFQVLEHLNDFEIIGYGGHFVFQNKAKIFAKHLQAWGRFHEASFVFSFLKVKEGGFLTFGKASLKSCFTKPPLFHLTKDFP